MNLKSHLVDDWNQAHKWLSVQIAALLSAVALVYDQFPTYLQAYIPQPVFNKIMLAMGIAMIIGRLKKQGEKTQ